MHVRMSQLLAYRQHVADPASPQMDNIYLQFNTLHS